MPDYGDDRGFRGNVPQRAMTRIDHQRAAQDQWDANRRYSQAQMLMNEPGARAKEREVARDFGGNIRSFQPHRQEGINTRTDPARATELGWAGNWPGTPLGYSMDPRWNYTVTPGDPFEYTQRSDGIEDMSYMSPSPFPYPGRPRPPIGRPPWGEIDWVGLLGGGVEGGEFDIASSDEYRIWNSIRRKHGADVANQMMGGNVAVNRGGIMGLI